MAIEVDVLFLDPRDGTLNATQRIMPAQFHTTTNMVYRSISVVLAQAGLNSANLQQNLRQAIVSAIQTTYGESYSTNDIAIYNGPQ